MDIVVNNFIPWGTYKAITIFKWIFVKDIEKITDTDVRHEEIHWLQQLETLIIGFYILYGLMYLWELLRCSLDKSRGARADGVYRSTNKRAYRSIAFEREAYAHENDKHYAINRKPWAWARES